VTGRNRGARVPAPPDTLEIAVSLARIGWSVFPVSIYEDANGKRHKVPAVKWKAEATTDVATVKSWWRGEHAGRWIGVYAGAAGIVVLDVDPGGDDSIAAAGLEIPPTLNYPTHRHGGRHYVYAAPEGVELTIAKGLLDGVDVRSGAGLMIYYGPRLNAPPTLAPAPDWLLVTRDAPRYADGVDRAPGADETAFRERLMPGKPDAEIRATLRSVAFPDGAAHDVMLETVTTLVGLGVKGHRGVDRLLDETRERYVGRHPDRGRDWDNALQGSIARLGLPPLTLEIPKTERKALAKRNDPDVIEAVTEERKKAHKIKKHAEAMTAARPQPGNRVLEDGPLAAELADVLGASWAYARGYGLMRWRGKVWQSAEEHSIVEAVRRLIRDIEIDEHAAAAMRGDNKAIDKARTLLSRNRSLNVARLVVGILAEAEPAFDSHPDLLNTPTGVVDLRTSKLKKHRADYFFTKMTAVPFDPAADMTRWATALEAVPPKVAAWLKVRFGQAATGYTPDDDTLLIFEGTGSNGKTTIVTAPLEALGDYATMLPERLLLANPGDHPTTLMTLMGARLGVIEELPEGRQLNVKRLKDAVGTPKITARHMRQDDVTFRTTHALMLNTNYLPIVAETDDGTWRRLAIVRFRRKYKLADDPERRKGDLLADPKIRRYFESTPDPGVLRWIVEGAREWYAGGEIMPRRPAVVIADTSAWRSDADPVMSYVSERLERDEGFAIAALDLADDFNAWLERRGHKSWSQQTINSRFGGHVSLDGIERKPVKWSGSVRPSRPATVFGAKPIPKVTTAWRGVRFVDETQIKSEAERDAEALADLERRASL
jgi:putative DNA primase/helicase